MKYQFPMLIGLQKGIYSLWWFCFWRAQYPRCTIISNVQVKSQMFGCSNIRIIPLLIWKGLSPLSAGLLLPFRMFTFCCWPIGNVKRRSFSSLRKFYCSKMNKWTLLFLIIVFGQFILIVFLHLHCHRLTSSTVAQHPQDGSTFNRCCFIPSTYSYFSQRSIVWLHWILEW
jgi:hypothetical protein